MKLVLVQTDVTRELAFERFNLVLREPLELQQGWNTIQLPLKLKDLSGQDFTDLRWEQTEDSSRAGVIVTSAYFSAGKVSAYAYLPESGASLAPGHALIAFSAYEPVRMRRHVEAEAAPSPEPKRSKKKSKKTNS